MAPLDDRSTEIDPLAPHRAALSAVVRPVSTAQGLPNAFYRDPALYEVEKRRVFFDGWAGLGFAHEVPAPGDAKPVDYLGQPLLLLRDRSGAVRVYQNVCRHRGMILIEAPRKIEGAIRCPYHSWCYGLDGRLVSTPHVGGPGRNTHPDVDRGALGLLEVRAHVWMGVVYVNLSGDAAPFEEAHAEIIGRWAEFDRPALFGGPESAFELDVACNWKLAVENYCESYHLPWVHPGLNSYSRLEDHYNICEYGHYSGQGSLVYSPRIGDGSDAFPDFDGLSGKWDEGSEYLTLFPNVMLGVHRDHTFAILLEPRGPAWTRERVAIFYADDSALSEPRRALRAEHAAQWKEVFVEDVFVVEGMQKGREADRFDGGRFSPAMDEPTHVFHDWVARRMGAEG
ncbi:MAG: aromatic ring-hydroxylating dioxygenase subunit alpha [Pseudomonadota bacterium]